MMVLLLILTTACGGRTYRTSDDSTERQTIEHAGRTRSYILRLPPTMPSAGRHVPLVIALHGGGGNGANAERMMGFTPIARAKSFVVVYPDGSARGRSPLLTWNAGHCCGFAMQSGIDDVGFLRALIDHLASRYPIDPKRVYVTGMSNGAMMSHRAGIELADRIAAIAPVVGGVFGDEVARMPRVSAIMINGMLDRSVPYAGGVPGGPFAGSWDGTPVRPAPDQARFWAGVNGCRATPESRDTGTYIHIRYECPVPIAVELYGVKDNGHAWPGGQRGSRMGDAPSGAINASEVIWEFFSSHPKR